MSFWLIGLLSGTGVAVLGVVAGAIKYILDGE